jgi:hypothetical protein
MHTHFTADYIYLNLHVSNELCAQAAQPSTTNTPSKSVADVWQYSGQPSGQAKQLIKFLPHTVAVGSTISVCCVVDVEAGTVDVQSKL